MSYIEEIKFDLANLSAFGDLEVAELTPQFHLDFVYGINSQTGVKTETNGGTVDTNNRNVRLQTGTNAAGTAIFESTGVAKYRAGLATVARFTPLFTTGVANSLQGVGAGYQVSSSIVDYYAFGYNGTSYGIVHYIDGTPTWVAQASWNGTSLGGDNMDGNGPSGITWDPTKGTPCYIKYPYLGYGNVEFFIQNPNTGRPVLVHMIKYSNTYTSTQLSNPTLKFLAIAQNNGNTTNLTVQAGSVGFFTSGMKSYIGNPRGVADNVKTGITTETNIISIRNATTYNGVTNRALIRLSLITPGSSANNGNHVFRFKWGATLGGTPSFSPYNGSTADNGVTITGGNSVVSIDTAGTTVTGGNYYFGIGGDNPNSLPRDLEQYNLFIAPGETLTISGFSTVSSSMSVVINWSEDI